MAAPYDVVVSIGGQSFIDGFWRLLGPALERLTNPLPLALPGFSNAQMRVTNLTPLFPTTTFGTGLQIIATVELTAETLLQIVPDAGGAAVTLAPLPLNLTSLGGSIKIPDHAGAITDLAFSGTPPLGIGAGKVKLNAVDGVLAIGAGLAPTALGLPLPAIVPVALDLTPGAPLNVRATVPLVAAGPSPETRFSLALSVGDVRIGSVAPIADAAAAAVTAALQKTVDQVSLRLGLTSAIPAITIAPADVAELLKPIPDAVAHALDEALSPLFAQTGRLIYPKPDRASASCDVLALPTAADVSLTASLAHGYTLQLGLSRTSGSGSITALPSAGGPLECQVAIGNDFVLDLLCCLVEQLPTLSLPTSATIGTTDVAGREHLRCCNFTGVTGSFGPITLTGGGISICIDGKPEGTKTFTIVGKFGQSITVPAIAAIVPTVATVSAYFALPIAFDLDEVAALTNLRVRNVAGVRPVVDVSIAPSGWFTFAVLTPLVPFIIGANSGHQSGGGGGFWSGVWNAITTVFGGALGLVLGVVLGPIVGGVTILLVYLACGVARWLLSNAIRTIFNGAARVKSPVAVPPGLFEAFGRLSPARIVIDDLIASGVLQTPTSPWGLLPRFGQARLNDPGTGEVGPRAEG